MSNVDQPLSLGTRVAHQVLRWSMGVGFLVFVIDRANDGVLVAMVERIGR
jgi:hypothetical protein